MSPLTKALVVLVTILSVLELGLFVAYSSKHAELSDSLQAERTSRIAAETLAKENQAEISAALAQQSEDASSLRNENSSLKAGLLAAENAKQQAEAQLQAERARNDKTEQAIARLTASGQQDATLREALIAELATSRAEVVDLRTKVVELSDANNELSSSLASLERSGRWVAEELVAAKEKTDKYEKMLAEAGVSTADAQTQEVQTPTASQPINGAITQVDVSTDTPLVAVNVGANDGVAKGMEFMVHRGDQYVGKLVIDSVDSDVSAGRMVLVKGQPQADDMVYAGPY